MVNKKSVLVPIDRNDLVKETEKMKLQIREASNQLRSLDLNLGASLRLNIRLLEMQAYLSGLLYASGETASLSELQPRH
jgi:hypothetical protein